MPTLCLRGGTLYDPTNGVDGVVGDVWIDRGRIVEAPNDPSAKADRVIDITGCIVMPGGIDLHCHIAGPKVNAARKMLPEDRRKSKPYLRKEGFRSGTIGSVPSTFATGYLYAGLGYTTAFDAAIPPLAARHVHEEFHDTPVLDKGFFTLVGNNHFLMEQMRKQQPELVRSFLGWLLESVRGYGLKIVNPGGVEAWKAGAGNIANLDAEVPGFGITPCDILRELAAAADDLQVPHPVHVHCNNLGMPGNWSTTLDTMRSLDGHRGHITHIQFHSYGGDPDDQATFHSRVPDLVDYVNAHPEITVDVGQVMFGNTVSMTGDGPLGHYLHKVIGGKWFSGDLELESGCGIVPIVYRNKSFVHALQWAVGLEWYLLINDPWQIALSTDHPNGASFLAYPQVMALLMDRSRRQDVINTLPAKLKEISTLAEIDREYSLYEIAIITRAAPAKMLGLKDKGHLGIGAAADVAVYTPQDDVARMFELPRYVIKGGEIVIDDGELRAAPEGDTLSFSPGYDTAAVPTIRDWFEDHYTLRFANYPVTSH
ncbi:formylmethanofuran dehydrogenase subunit A [bacterium]|nr:formylmethanofuran dehydrogenase subunit A [bacterium]